ncbi:hypothetical protein NECAME_03633 [Necator americanus]|uniref:Uncharacterized protein n=1 Tax=Necator americanus TaxID=51031 RepID=W2T1J0_NECAM|nr:hypothetical protein NECAME_03633 [Necator americanus]ETN75860.1 hypothetical protein NECAME_03633 [Necator americanus]
MTTPTSAEHLEVALRATKMPTIPKTSNRSKSSATFLKENEQSKRAIEGVKIAKIQQREAVPVPHNDFFGKPKLMVKDGVVQRVGTKDQDPLDELVPLLESSHLSQRMITLLKLLAASMENAKKQNLVQRRERKRQHIQRKQRRRSSIAQIRRHVRVTTFTKHHKHINLAKGQTSGKQSKPRRALRAPSTVTSPHSFRTHRPKTTTTTRSTAAPSTTTIKLTASTTLRPSSTTTTTEPTTATKKTSTRGWKTTQRSTTTPTTTSTTTVKTPLNRSPILHTAGPPAPTKPKTTTTTRSTAAPSTTTIKLTTSTTLRPSSTTTTTEPTTATKKTSTRRWTTTQRSTTTPTTTSTTTAKAPLNRSPVLHTAGPPAPTK